MDAIVVMSYWDQDLFDVASFANDFSTLSAVAHRIYVVETIPWDPAYDPLERAKEFFSSGLIDRSGALRESFQDRMQEITPILQQGILQSGTKAQLLSPQNYLCKEDHCIYYHDGRLLYFNPTHLTIAGSKYLKPMFISALQSVSDQ